ncbi:MAG: endonuclease III [Bacteriovoracaceae bacterium]|nr:endonuclease III [Bacteriovoracaceae bacterium]
MNNRHKRAKIVLSKLTKLYPNPAITLNFKNDYTLLIAVVLSAQCTDKRVNQVTSTLFEKACTPVQMVELSVEFIEQIIRPCGLVVRKSNAIYNLSKILLEKHDGLVPRTFLELEALPGVGHKTASVVMSQAFGIPAFPVDTHIHRLAKRWRLSAGNNVRQTEEDLKKLFARDKWNLLHLQFIYYGREYCPAKGHDLNKCVICNTLKEV